MKECTEKHITVKVGFLIFMVGFIPAISGGVIGGFMSSVDPKSAEEFLNLRGVNIFYTMIANGLIWGIFISASQMILIGFIFLMPKLRNKLVFTNRDSSQQL